jgi:hypothetical protein
MRRCLKPAFMDREQSKITVNDRAMACEAAFSRRMFWPPDVAGEKKIETRNHGSS